jgi:hypothetical protein
MDYLALCISNVRPREAAEPATSFFAVFGSPFVYRGLFLGGFYFFKYTTYESST